MEIATVHLATLMRSVLRILYGLTAVLCPDRRFVFEPRAVRGLRLWHTKFPLHGRSFERQLLT